MRHVELGLALFAGCVIGWLWGERPDLLREFSWLLAMTAFGTVGTAIAAVAVPFAQNRQRIEEQRYNDLLVDWVLVHEVLHLCHELRAITAALKSSWEAPSSAPIQHIYSQLGLAKQSTISHLGRLIINDLLYQAVVIQDAIERRSSMSQYAKDLAMASDKSPSVDSQTQQSSERLDQLAHMTSNWIDRILLEFKQIGRDPLNVVRGSGSAHLNIEAKEGRPT